MAKILIVVILCVVHLGCTSNSYEKEAWKVVKDTRGGRELANFLSHYKKSDSKAKYVAACMLVSNMPDKYGVSSRGAQVYDVDIAVSDSLVRSVDYSFKLLEQSPFLKAYSYDMFLEYILPYRIADEPLEYGWKWDIRNLLHVSSTNIISAAEEINAQIKLNISALSYGDLPQSYTSLLRSGYGKCDDRSMLVVMALRSVGIPAAYEFVPFWGSSNNGHSFASVIMPDGSLYPLQNTDKVTKDGYLSRKVPKIYRKMYSQQKWKGAWDEAPRLFAANDLLDVTSLHPIGFIDIELSSVIKETLPAYYLSVFSPKSWLPVAKSCSKSFKSVGTGYRFNEKELPEAEDLGDGILYLPSSWGHNRIVPIGNPIIVSSQGVREIVCDTSCLTRVEIARKYPLNYRIANFARFMTGGVFEGANQSDFSDGETIYRIAAAPKPQMQYVKIKPDKAYRYVRYKRLNGTFSIAEIAAKNDNGEYLPFKPMLCDALQQEKKATCIYDGDPLTYFQMGAGLNLWAGMDFGQPVQISELGFAPRNDDNAINPRDDYELFYWQDSWKSLGITKSAGDTLVYENVPSGALLWLRNLTRGKEERPFTYERSKQIWW